MGTVTRQEKRALPKDTDHSSEEDESYFYTYQEDSVHDENTDKANHLEKSNSNSLPTSDTESIQREASGHDDTDAPTTEVIRRETSLALPKFKGIAALQPIAELNGPGQAIVKDARSALSLRLDLNLDVEVELKAKIHGDLTLSLLFVAHYHYHIWEAPSL